MLVGLAFGGLAGWLRLSGRSNFTDFDQIWIAARAVLHGGDPYLAVPRSFPMQWYYPFPAALVGLPFVALPVGWAGPVFVGIGFALLAYGLLGRGPWAIVALLNWPALQTAQQCQWSATITAAALLPWLGCVIVAKPTTAMTVAGAYLSRRWLAFNLSVGALLVCASFVLQPTWVTQWLSAVRSAHHFMPIALRPGGVLLLLALLRWRRPEARLLALLAIVPQTGGAYDALPLVLILSDRREAIGFGFLSLATIPFIVPQDGAGDAFVRALAHNQTVYIIMLYLPALTLVLLKDSPVLHWLSQRADTRPSRRPQTPPAGQSAPDPRAN